MTSTNFLGFQNPIEAVGSMVLVRRSGTPAGGDIGMTGFGGFVFAPFITGTRATTIDDPHLERGALSPSRIFFTEASGSVRRLMAATAATITTVATLPAGDWHLGAVDLTNTNFFLLNRSTGGVLHVRPGNPNVTMATVPATGSSNVSMMVSPNGQNLLVTIPPSTPFGTGTVLRLPTAGGPAITLLSTTILSKAVWLDDRFCAVNTLVGSTNRLQRIDNQALGTVTFLTMAPMNVDAGSDINVSDDHEWLTFVSRQVIGSTVEKVPAVMRVRNGAAGANGPGGAYVELGDYRQATPQAAYTTWTSISAPVVSVAPAVGAQSKARVIWSGTKNGNPNDLFRGDVWDDVIVASRGLNATTVNVETLAQPGATFWSVLISFSRPPAPVSLPTVFLNHQLVDTPSTLFTVAVQPATAVSVPINLPPLNGLPPINMLMQGAWLNSGSALPWASNISELPIF